MAISRRYVRTAVADSKARQTTIRIRYAVRIKNESTPQLDSRLHFGNSGSVGIRGTLTEFNRFANSVNVPRIPPSQIRHCIVERLRVSSLATDMKNQMPNRRKFSTIAGVSLRRGERTRIRF